MYFETIHNVEQFDEVQEDDDAYSTYLESDTDELDDVTLGNLLFAHVSGDSASVLCLEQISDIMRERERKPNNKVGHPTAPVDGPGQVDDGEREYAGRATECRVSHHSGSDGMYDQPEEAFAPEDTNPAAEHIYETLDDCGEQYVLYIAKGSDDSGDTPVHAGDTPRHSGGTPTMPSSDVSDRSDCSDRKPKLPKQNSLPGSSELPQNSERRKSEGDVLRRKKRCTGKAADSSVAPKLPPNRPTRMSEPAEYAAIPATSVERRNSSNKGQAVGAQVPQATPQPLVIKHKGKTYLIPVIEAKETKVGKCSRHQQSKKQSRLNPNSLSRHTISVAVPPQMVVAGVTLRPMSRSESSAFSTCAYQSTTLPISVKTSDQFSPQRRKTSKQSAVSCAPHHVSTQVQQVTHYGVL